MAYERHMEKKLIITLHILHYAPTSMRTRKIDDYGMPNSTNTLENSLAVSYLSRDTQYYFYVILPNMYNLFQSWKMVYWETPIKGLATK